MGLKEDSIFYRKSSSFDSFGSLSYWFDSFPSENLIQSYDKKRITVNM